MCKQTEGTVRLVDYGYGQGCRISFSPYVPGLKSIPQRDCREKMLEGFLTNCLGVPTGDARTAINEMAKTGNGWIQNTMLTDKQLLAFDHEGVLLS